MRLIRVYRMKKMNKTGNGAAKWVQVSKHKYLAWVPGRDRIWEENTEAVFRQRFAEGLTRGVKVAV